MKKVGSYFMVLVIASVIISSGYNIAAHVPEDQQNSTLVRKQVDLSLQRIIDPLFE